MIGGMPGTLYVCATPIGNLADASARLSDVLRAADIVFAEDTRRTSKLLAHLGATTAMRSLFVGNERSRVDELVARLEAGATVALVSDAGMPTVSDPGAIAIDAAIACGANVIAIPGPSAVTTAIAASGLGGDRFVFEGFLPRKGIARRTMIDEVARQERTIVVFSAPSRVDRDLADLAAACGPDRRIAVCRELTKLHEETWRGTLGEAVEEFAPEDRRRGEFTLVIEGRTLVDVSIDEAVEAALGAITEGASTSDAVRSTADLLGVSRRQLYDRVLRERS
jgi:16S rRNA (cytidine1402-2'-O)-methyltransferase